MKKKLKVSIGIVLFLLGLTTFRVFWMTLDAGTDRPIAENGVLDLTASHLDEKAVELRGEWLFFPNKWIDPNNIQQQMRDGQRVTVPTDQSALFQRSKEGKGTYYLRILLSNEHEYETTFLKLYAREIVANPIIYVNGEQITTTDKQNIDFRPIRALFTQKNNTIDLVIHVMKDELSIFQEKGITQEIYLGSVSALEKWQFPVFFSQLAVAILLLLHTLYAGLIYGCFSRKKELIYVGLMTMLMSVSIVLDHDRVLLQLFPQLPFEKFYLGRYVAYTSSMYFCLLFIHSVLLRTKLCQQAGKWMLSWIHVAYVVMLGSAVLQWNSMVQMITFFFMFLVSIWMLLMFIILIRDEKIEGNLYVYGSIMAIFISSLWAIINQFFHLTYSYYPFDVLLAVLMMTMFITNRFFDTFQKKQGLAIQLQQANKVKDQFIAHTSHELRNPLYGILSIAELLHETEQDNLSKDGKKDVENMITMSRRMSIILNDLLDLSKLEENEVRLHLEKVCLESVVSSVMETLTFLTKGKSIQLALTIPKENPLVLADENRLYQIFFNLLQNAIKYMEDGIVRVRVEWKQGNKQVEILIEDTGIGIEEQQIKHIFHPYFQAEDTAGIGLGLTISKQLVELHGSELKVISSSEKGTVFQFFLPVIEAEKTTDFTNIEKMSFTYASHEREKENREGIANILVIDDDPYNLAMVERILSVENYSVSTTRDPLGALESVYEQNWDLVIADVTMPKMSGFELTKQIRSCFSLSTLPILLLTKQGKLEGIRTGFDCGANDYLIKPIEREELKLKVRALVQLKRSIEDRMLMEVALLKTQMQPHFLFNTLNAIAILSETDHPKMAKLLNEFGRYLHLSLLICHPHQLMQLQQEIKLVQSYLFIQEVRFADRLSVCWQVHAQIDCVETPPFALQTLVEFVLNESLLKREEGGILRIRMIEQEDGLVIEVADPAGFSNHIQPHQLIETNIGLNYTASRIRQLTGKGLSIVNNTKEGLCLAFTIPLS